MVKISGKNQVSSSCFEVIESIHNVVVIFAQTFEADLFSSHGVNIAYI